MGARIIQGFFVGGARLAPPTALPSSQSRGPAPVAQRTSGAPAPVFARQAASPVQRKAAPGRPPLVHAAAPAAGAAQPLQRFGGDDSFAVDPAQIGLVRSGGKPLPGALLAKMETAFGADFSGVRVHVGPQASRIGALAFTTGNDLYFAPGQYEPDSVKGQQLIGHELAHVIQQRQGRVRAPGGGVAVVQDRALEAEADRLGMQAAAHVAPMPILEGRGRTSSDDISRLKQVFRRSTALRHEVVQLKARTRAAAQKPALIQRQTPRRGEPNLLGWSPTYGNNFEPYTGAERLGVDGFNDTWKKKAMAAWLQNGILYEHQLDTKTSMIYARVRAQNFGGRDQIVPWDGTGIDHVMSVHEIGPELIALGKELNAEFIKTGSIPSWRKGYFSVFINGTGAWKGWGSNDRQRSQVLREVREGLATVRPTKWAAMAYYHDFDNATPMLSRDNSSKGASGGGLTMVPSKTQNMLMQQAQKVATDIQIILNHWGGGTVAGSLATYIDGVRSNLSFLSDFLATVIKDDRMSSPISSSGYHSPVRYSK